VQEDHLPLLRVDVWITTSGHFSTATLKYVIDKISADQIHVLSSMDYQYQAIENTIGAN